MRPFILLARTLLFVKTTITLATKNQLALRALTQSLATSIARSTHLPLPHNTMSLLSLVTRGTVATPRLAGIGGVTPRFFGTTGGTILKFVASRGPYNVPHIKGSIRQLSTTSIRRDGVKESVREYDRISKATLEGLSDALDELAESTEGYDLEYSVGTLSFLY